MKKIQQIVCKHYCLWDTHFHG